jgi:hypothetical protein
VIQSLVSADICWIFPSFFTYIICAAFADAQIDVLVNQWEQSGSDTESVRASGDRSRASQQRESPSRSGTSSLRLSRRDYDQAMKGERAYRETLARSSREFHDDLLNVGEDVESERELDALRQSLGSALDNLSDKERLSDDEYRTKVCRIRTL